MGSINESLAATPVEYLPTGDKAFILAWAALSHEDRPGHDIVAAILCLEDGTCVVAEIDQFKFDYRWHEGQQAFVDVSAIPTEEGSDADTDQGPEDLGSQGFPGPVPDADRADAGDPGDQP